MSGESIEPPTTSNNSLAWGMNGPKIKVKFNGNCLKQERNNFLSQNQSKHICFLWNKFMAKRCKLFLVPLIWGQMVVSLLKSTLQWGQQLLFFQLSKNSLVSATNSELRP